MARRCGYCGGPVATLRCGGCYALNAPEARHCSACGRELGLEPIPDPEAASLGCPQCEIALRGFASGPGRLFDCDGCGGQFVEHALLRDLLERREVRGEAVPRRPQLPPSSPQIVHYLPCPVCQRLMNRHNFGAKSGVIVDICGGHGVWFHAHDLGRVLDFVEGGGLDRARLQNAEDLGRDRIQEAGGQLRTDQLPHPLPFRISGEDSTIAHALPSAWSTGFADDGRELAAAIFHRLEELFEHLTRD